MSEILKDIQCMFVTGDLHGEIDIHKLTSHNWKKLVQEELTGVNILFQTGDFGLVWEPEQSKVEEYWLDWLDSKPFYTLFIAGNHENYDRLERFPLIEFHGGKAAQISEKVYYLKNGYVYDFDGKKFWMFGGATSIDKHRRVMGRSWWQQEIPTYTEMMFGLSQLEAVNHKVDYIITHTLPKTVLESNRNKDLGGNFLEKIRINSIYPCPVAAYLDNILEKVRGKYKHWYTGHFHFDCEVIENITVLYQNIERIK
ncbi:MAG: metallophosphoesterase [Novosphingobium sp.]|nr:metallophosphoesterase [Novosphingobium sp.]